MSIGLIPVMRVNYKFTDLLIALFISERSNKYRQALKQRICNFFSVDDVILTSSARCAIYMILKSLPQKKVIIPAYTCEVVEEAVKLTGKEIKYAHVSKSTLNIVDYPEIDSDTIVIATHQYGLPCEMDELVTICNEKKAVLIEDCAGSLGSKVFGKLTGTLGDFGVFSFSASKTIHSPTKGGFIVAKNAQDLKNINENFQISQNSFSYKIKQLLKGIGFCLNKNRLFCNLFHILLPEKKKDSTISNNLIDDTYQICLYEWQAFVVNKQFKNIDKTIKSRRQISYMYEKFLNNPNIVKPSFNQESVNIRYAIQVANRKNFVDNCYKQGVQVGCGYLKSICPDDYLVEKEIFEQIVYLPIGSNYSQKEIKKVISVVNTI